MALVARRALELVSTIGLLNEFSKGFMVGFPSHGFRPLSETEAKELFNSLGRDGVIQGRILRRLFGAMEKTASPERSMTFPHLGQTILRGTRRPALMYPLTDLVPWLCSYVPTVFEIVGRPELSPARAPR